jgi:hypothetical protein
VCAAVWAPVSAVLVVAVRLRVVCAAVWGVAKAYKPASRGQAACGKRPLSATSLRCVHDSACPYDVKDKRFGQGHSDARQCSKIARRSFRNDG